MPNENAMILFNMLTFIPLVMMTQADYSNPNDSPKNYVTATGPATGDEWIQSAQNKKE